MNILTEDRAVDMMSNFFFFFSWRREGCSIFHRDIFFLKGLFSPSRRHMGHFFPMIRTHWVQLCPERRCVNNVGVVRKFLSLSCPHCYAIVIFPISCHCRSAIAILPLPLYSILPFYHRHSTPFYHHLFSIAILSFSFYHCQSSMTFFPLMPLPPVCSVNTKQFPFRIVCFSVIAHIPGYQCCHIWGFIWSGFF